MTFWDFRLDYPACKSQVCDTSQCLVLHTLLRSFCSGILLVLARKQQDINLKLGTLFLSDIKWNIIWLKNFTYNDQYKFHKNPLILSLVIVHVFGQTVQQMDGWMDLTKPVASRDILQINSKLFYGSTTNTNTHLCPLKPDQTHVIKVSFSVRIFRDGNTPVCVT